MQATLTIDTKTTRSGNLLAGALLALLESKGFEVTASGPVLVISGEPNDLYPHIDNNQQVTEAVIPVKTALQTAIEVVHGDREQTYGDAGKNLRTIAAYWNIHLQAAKSIEAHLTEDDVCGMMRLLKEARLASNPQHRDSLVDVGGYVELQDIVNLQKQKA